MCVHCESKDFIKVEIRCKGQTYVPIADGWGFHNKTCIVRDINGLFHIYKDDIVTQPIEYCPKCGRKLGKEEIMAIKLTKEQFDRAIDGMVSLKYDGTWSYKVGQHNGRDVAIVLGWTDAFAEGGAKYQIKLFGKTWTLCGKIAIRVGNTETDFEYDWVMPVSKDGIDYDNERIINDTSFDYLVSEAEAVMFELKNGVLKIEE